MKENITLKVILANGEILTKTGIRNKLQLTIEVGKIYDWATKNGQTIESIETERA